MSQQKVVTPTATNQRRSTTRKQKRESKFHVVKGSDWAELKYVQKGLSGKAWDEIWIENNYIKFIREQNGIFVNDKFIELWDFTNGLLFLDGGYGSSKTTYAITRLLVKCMENDYFRCFYGRNAKTEARNLHSNIITEIKRNKWESLFEFSEKPTGSPQILYVGTGPGCLGYGNKFDLFGCDDVESLKGIDNPTDILIDEINQISFEAFGMLWTRLRTPGCELQLIGCFNNCDVYPDHWLVKYIYGDENGGTDAEKILIDALSKSNIIRHHSCYTDNHFQNPDRYYEQLRVKAGGDQRKIDAYAKGEWGIKLNGQPYYKMFNKELHVRNVEYDPTLSLHFSFDENVNPYFPCLIAQFDGTNINIIDEIAAENPRNTLSWVCNEICSRYRGHKEGIYIYGDATSKKDDVKIEKGKNFFTIAADYLQALHPTIRSSDSNPNNKIRQDFINAIFGINFERIFINISPKCKHCIEDLMNVEENPDGKKGGKDKHTSMVNGKKGVQRWGHFGDCLDYLVCEAYKYAYLLFQSGGVTYNVVGGGRVARNSINETPVAVVKDVEKVGEEEYFMRYGYNRKSRNGYY